MRLLFTFLRHSREPRDACVETSEKKRAERPKEASATLTLPSLDPRPNRHRRTLRRTRLTLLRAFPPTQRLFVLSTPPPPRRCSHPALLLPLCCFWRSHASFRLPSLSPFSPLSFLLLSPHTECFWFLVSCATARLVSPFPSNSIPCHVPGIFCSSPPTPLLPPRWPNPRPLASSREADSPPKDPTSHRVPKPLRPAPLHQLRRPPPRPETPVAVAQPISSLPHHSPPLSPDSPTPPTSVPRLRGLREPLQPAALGLLALTAPSEADPLFLCSFTPAISLRAVR